MTSAVETWLQLLRSSSNAEERYRALQGVIAAAAVGEAVAGVSGALDDVDSAVRAGAARWLASQALRSPRPGSDSLWQSIGSRWHTHLGDADPDVRFESARGLLALDAGAEPAISVLLELLRDDETQPLMVAAILKTLGGSAAVPMLAQTDWQRFLGHGQADVREQAARLCGLCGRGNESCTIALLPLLDDEEPFVREEAARALGNIGVAMPAVIAALTTAVADEDAVVAATADESLKQLARPTS